MKDFRHRSQNTAAPGPNAPNITAALEAIDNLTYLALHEAEKAESVRFYLKQARERLGLIIEAAKRGSLGKT